MLNKALCFLIVLFSLLLFPGATGIVTGGDTTLQGNLEFVSPVVFDGNAIFDTDVCVSPSTGVCPLPKTGTISGGGTIDFKGNMTFTGSVTFTSGATFNADMCILGGTPVESYSLNTSGTYVNPVTPIFEMKFEDTCDHMDYLGEQYNAQSEVGPLLRNEIGSSGSNPCTKITDGTYPNGLSAAQGTSYSFTTNERLYADSHVCPDGHPCGADALQGGAGDVSVLCLGTIRQTNGTGGNILIGKLDNIAVNESWVLISSDDGHVDFQLSRTGDWAVVGDVTGLASPVGYITFGKESSILGTYHYIGNHTSTMRLYVDDNPVVTTGSAWSGDTAIGPIYSCLTTGCTSAVNCCSQSPGGIGIFDIGGIGSNASMANFADCRIFPRVITASEFTAIKNSWRGVVSSKGNALTTVNAAPPAMMIAPPNSGTEPFLKTPQPNTSQVGSFAVGQGGLFVPDSTTNFTHRFSFESWSGSPLQPVGWSGGNRVNALFSPDTTTVAHGLYSAKLTQTGGYMALYDSCSANTLTSGTSYVFSGWAKKISGTASCSLLLYAYTDSACSVGQVLLTYSIRSDIPTTWTQITDVFTPAATYSSVLITIDCDAATAVTNWDAIELHAGTYAPDSVCGADTDTNTTCNASIVSGTYQLGTHNWHINATISFPYSVASTPSARYLLYFPGTSGNQNRINAAIYNGWLYFDCYDSAGTPIEVDVACNPTVHNKADISLYHSYGGEVKACCNGSCGTSLPGCTQTTPGSTFYLGNTVSNGMNVWVRELDFLN